MTQPVPLIELALVRVRPAARMRLVEAGAPRAAERARAAIRSAEGALRHAHRRHAVVPTPLFDTLEGTDAAAH